MKTQGVKGAGSHATRKSAVCVENDVNSRAVFISERWNEKWISLGEQDFKHVAYFVVVIKKADKAIVLYLT